MNIFIKNLIPLGCWLLLTSTVTAQESTAFQIHDQARSYLFNLPSRSFSTNPPPSGVEGVVTILARHFTTTNQSGIVTVIFQDAVVCWTSSPEGKQREASVATFSDYSISYPGNIRILVHGDLIRLADLSEKTFEPQLTPTETYTGEEAIKKMKEMGLEPPEDMDWEKATNR